MDDNGIGTPISTTHRIGAAKTVRIFFPKREKWKILADDVKLTKPHINSEHLSLPGNRGSKTAVTKLIHLLPTPRWQQVVGVEGVPPRA